MAKHADPTLELAPPAGETVETTTVSIDSDDNDADDTNCTAPGHTSRWQWLRRSRTSAAAATGVALIVVLGALAAWQGGNSLQQSRADEHNHQLVAAATNAAVNLTTISAAEPERDIDRILDSSTGPFHDDFQARSEPFIEAVKQAQSTSTGTVTAAGIESQSGDQTQVLVAVSVTTTLPGAPKSDPRSWRMRITVKEVDHAAKVSNVQFVV